MLIAGAVLLIPGLALVLLAAATAVTSAGLAGYVALSIVGGGSLALGLLLTVIGHNSIRLSRLRPTETLGELRLDAALVKNQLGTRNATTP